MEVASPLTLGHATAGTKRSLVCSPQLLDTPSRGRPLEIENDDPMQRSIKRRRFHEASVDSLSESFSSHSPFFASSIHAGKSRLVNSNTGGPSFKRHRVEATLPSPSLELQRVVKEQVTLIESLKKDKSSLESSLNSQKTENERIVKENQILRKAVTIQQERQNHAENELKAAHEYRAGAEEQIKKYEQVILSLRYHLQAQQTIGNDFMSDRPPDVY